MPKIPMESNSIGSTSIESNQASRRGDVLADSGRRESCRGSSCDVRVTCGISFSLDFGAEERAAWDAMEDCQHEGLDVGEPEEERGSWRLPVRVDLLNGNNLDAQVALIDLIAQKFGSTEVRSSNSFSDATNQGPGHCIRDAAKSSTLTQIEFLAASTAYRMGKYLDAAQLWSSISSRNELEQGLGYYWAGRAYLKAEEGEHAEAMFSSLAENAESGSPMERLGKLGQAWSLLDQHKTHEAETGFLEFLESPWQSVAQYGLGCCRAREGDFHAAIGWLKLAFRRSPHLKYECRNEPSLRAMLADPAYAVQMEPNWWDRLRGRRRSRSKWRGYEEFVDQLELVELY